MKFFVKLIILLLIIAFAGPFFIKDNNGQPLLKIKDINFPKFPSFTEISNKAKPILRLGINEQSNHSDSFKTYKWKDKNGVVHYSDQKISGNKSQLTEIEGITILPVYKVNSKPQTKLDGSSSTSQLPTLTTIPVQQIPKLMNDTKQVKKLLENRKKHQDQILNEWQ